MENSAKNHLIYIAGPTASGKTAVAINLAKWLNTEIISCDSRQFFKELKVGAAPPTPEELNEVPHHFVQHLSVEDGYNAGQFGRDGLQKLDELFAVHQTVIMVGGSGLYADAVLFGFDDLPKANEDIREALANVLETEGLAKLQEQLLEKDPEYYAEAEITNPMRVIRALEVMATTRKKYSEMRSGKGLFRAFNHTIIALDMPRETLYERINQRVDRMVFAGLEDEARHLFPLAHLQTLNTVGYKEWFAHFRGELSREATIDLIKQNTRRFAKRQLTWLRRYKDAHWVPATNISSMQTLLSVKLKGKP